MTLAFVWSHQIRNLMEYNLNKLLERFILKVELQLQAPSVLVYLPTVQPSHSGILRQKRRTFQTRG